MNTLGWIYAFRDRGFERGVKIGRDANHPRRFKVAQCYTPRGIDLLGVWRVGLGLRTLDQAEAIARQALPLVSGHGGVEWRDLTGEQAIDRISENLELSPEPHSGNPRITTTYDDFRDPKKLLGNERDRQILWIYRENRTNTIKVQRTCSWAVPLEKVKTYSLLGFKPIASFAAIDGGPDWCNGNKRIHDVWVDLVKDLGFGEHHPQVGWLRSDVRAEAVVERARLAGLQEIRDWSSPPTGVRRGYSANR